MAAATNPAELSVQRSGGLGDSGTENRNLRSSATYTCGSQMRSQDQRGATAWRGRVDFS